MNPSFFALDRPKLLSVVLVYPSVASGTLFLATLFLAHLFVSTAYSAVLTSLLAAPRVRIPVDSIQDLVQYGQLPWAFERGTSTVEMFLVSGRGWKPHRAAVAVRGGAYEDEPLTWRRFHDG